MIFIYNDYCKIISERTTMEGLIVSQEDKAFFKKFGLNF